MSATPISNGTTEFLEEMLKGDIKGTAVQILQTCSAIARAKQDLSERDFKDLFVHSPYAGSPKVWSKLLQIGMDARLRAIEEHLPSSYTTIHLLHCLTDEELKKGVEGGHIHPKVSQGALNRWLRHERFQGTQESLPEDFSTVATVLGPSETEEETLQRFKGDLQKLAGIYGFKVQFGETPSMVAFRQQRSQDKSGELAVLLTKDLRSTWEGAPDNLKTLFALSSLDDLVHAPMTTFTGFLNKTRQGREEFWRFHALDYINKIALEYLKTDSRAQRFNYRRRLKEVSEKHGHLAKKIQETLNETMSY